jgi:hypothetical protein
VFMPMAVWSDLIGPPECRLVPGVKPDLALRVLTATSMKLGTPRPREHNLRRSTLCLGDAEDPAFDWGG